MKRIKTRKKHFRITNPLGFSLFCAMIVLVIGLIVGVVFLIRGGYVKDMLNCAKAELNGDRTVPTTVAETTPTPKATAAETDAPSVTPTETAEETPDIGTPTPETPTPPPLEPETPDPGATYQPTKDPNAPLAGFKIGIDPRRDRESKYTKECAYNLAFAQKLAAYLETKGAEVVLTRESNKSKISDSKRAKTIKNADCDIAIGLMCNEVDSKTSGCYIQTIKSCRSYAKALVQAYSSGTGIKIQNGKKDGLQSLGKNDVVGSHTGCPYVLLVMGNWKNKTERANLEDEAFQEQMIEAIYETLLGQLKQ